MQKKFFVFSLAVAFCCIISGEAVAAIKDSDHDGISDEGEMTLYRTNPEMFDTDGDGWGDGDEVTLGTHPLDGSDSPDAASENGTIRTGVFDSESPFIWYMARATGIVSFVLLTCVAAHGLIVSSRAFTRVYPGAVALEVHRFLSWAALATVVLHAGSFLFDAFFPMSIQEILIPFLLPRGSNSVLGFDFRWTTAFGIIALYLLFVLTISSEFRSKIPLKVWRLIHYASFLAYPLFLAHGLLSGSDSKQGWMLSIYGASAVLISVLTGVRLFFRNRAVRLAKTG